MAKENALMENVGLVLEGGAMRGVYTAGVLDFLMEACLYAQYVVGVSAGACHSLSYVSKQMGRSVKVNTSYTRDHRYLSFRNYIKEGNIFGMKFMFDEIPKRLVPFDFETYNNTNITLVFAVTNCVTGKADYFSNKPCAAATQTDDMFMICRASSTMPLAAREVKINGLPYMDGGISDPIPVRKSLAFGNKKNIIVLTRDIAYRKSRSKYSQWLISKQYAKYPALVAACETRYRLYNETLDFIEAMEKDGSAFVLRPSPSVNVKRIERDPQKLTALYRAGYSDAKASYKNLSDWLTASN